MGRHKEFDEGLAVEQALELFWAKGYESTSIQDLCDHMGIHRGSLYDTFGDKKALFIRCLDRFRQITDDDMYSILSKNTTDPKQQLKQFFEAVIDNSMNNASLNRGCFFANTTLGAVAREPEVASRVEAHYDFTEQVYYQFVIRAQQSGHLKKGLSPREVARFLVNTKQGLSVLANTATERGVLEDACHVAMAILETE
ncbi:TetR/AcrR family transcriptional regulator [Paenibacillus pini]|uniref:Transcriptional regulator n=1 Tax=Paenibacillus pini JCM 16418 TaxID=1236976 RepID=W7Z734_9BACL|nr:TetR/AcrR family transcriptional regulator [Paenibacillus pini]GAF10094.1 transcriptional regulator [Paenibacillus pini JCM 16418]